MTSFDSTPHLRVRVDATGRIVIPADLRDRLGIAPGHDLLLSQDDRGLLLQTFAQAVRAAQLAFAPFRTPGVSVVDDLLADRRAEARREYGA